MRILLIGASPDHLPADEIAAIAADANMVIAVDGGLDVCAEAGIRAELAIGDMDSLQSPALLETQAEHAVVHSVDKDVSDLDLALAEARATGATEIIATGFTGGRIDHALASIGSFAGYADLAPSVHAVDSTAWILSPQGRAEVVIPGEGRPFSIVAVTPDARISCQGCAYPLHERRLPPLGSLGISNRVNALEAIVTAHEGVIIVVTWAYTSGS